MIKMNLLFIGICLGIFLNAQHRNDLDSLQLSNFKTADIVLLGEIVEIDTVKLISKLRVYEIFKGSTSKIITFIITDGYSFLPDKSGLWIIYGSNVAENTYSVSEQSLSRSNINPDKVWYYILNPAKTKKEIQEFENKRLNIKLKAITEWNNELYKLRNKLIEF